MAFVPLSIYLSSPLEIIVVVMVLSLLLFITYFNGQFKKDILILNTLYFRIYFNNRCIYIFIGII